MLFQNRRTQERAARHVAPIFTCALALAAVVGFTRPAAAQVGTNCGSEGLVLCGTVWHDLNMNGIQETGEGGYGGVEVTVFSGSTAVSTFFTNPDGSYYFDAMTLAPNTDYTVVIDIPSLGTGVQASPDGEGSDEESDSDGVDNTMGLSIFTFNSGFGSTDADFGFFNSQASQPGTGTPGYWKNHPNAWPVLSITIGGVLYSKDEAIAILTKPGKDKRSTMFSSLLSAKLNVLIGNDSSCVQSTIDAADAWMTGKGIPNTNPIVTAGSAAWAEGEPLHKLMDAYNNGLLCAPHRN